ACTAPNRFEMPFNSRMGALPFSDIKEFPITRGLREGHSDPCPLVLLLGRYCAGQYCSKSPTQISSQVRKPAAITVSSMLSTVTLTGTSRTDGTSLVPLLTAPVASSAVSSPFSSATASEAAASAWALIAL